MERTERVRTNPEPYKDFIVSLVFGVRLVGSLLVQMSTGRLLGQSHGNENGSWLLVVLLFQVHRVHGHDLLCSKKEE